MSKSKKNPSMSASIKLKMSEINKEIKLINKRRGRMDKSSVNVIKMDNAQRHHLHFLKAAESQISNGSQIK